MGPGGEWRNQEVGGVGPGGGRGGARRLEGWGQEVGEVGPGGGSSGDTLHCYPCAVMQLSLTRVNWSLCVCPSRKEMMVFWYLLEMFRNVSP